MVSLIVPGFMEIVICPAPRMFGGLLRPFVQPLLPVNSNCTMLPVWKPLPLMVRRWFVLSAVIVVGETELTEGTAAVTVIDWVPEEQLLFAVSEADWHTRT